MDVVYSPAYEVDIGPHVFPTRKYRFVKERLEAEGLLAAGTASGGGAATGAGVDAAPATGAEVSAPAGRLVAPAPATPEDLLRAHTPEYLRKIREDDFSPAERLQLEVPFSAGLRDAMILCCGGTILCGRRALADGAAVHLGGGFHHAFADHGEGFCLLNDVAVAARALLAEGAVRRVAVVDLDVHHGNGTAAIFAGDPTVFTFSMHQRNNYPAVKPPGDLDVGLDDGTADEAYLRLLDEHLPRVLYEQEPELVFYLAGADPYREDQLGGLGLSIEGLRARDRRVLSACLDRGIAVAVPLAGGYALHTDDTIAIHANTVREAIARASPSRKSARDPAPE